MEAKRAIKKKAPLSIRFIEQTSISKEALALVCSKGHKSAPRVFTGRGRFASGVVNGKSTFTHVEKTGDGEVITG